MLKKFKIDIKYSKISRSARQNSKFRARNLSGHMLKKVQNMSIKIWRDYELALRCNNDIFSSRRFRFVTRPRHKAEYVT